MTTAMTSALKTKHIFMALGVLGAGALVFWGDQTANDAVVAAVIKPQSAQSSGAPSTRSVERAESRSAINGAPAMVAIATLAPRIALISMGHTGLDGKKLEGGTSIFSAQNWLPPAPVDNKLKQPEVAPAPVAPPLNMTFLGKKLEAGVWEVYLARGTSSYIVQNQSVIEGTWRVDAVAPPKLTLTYLPLNQTQSMNIGESD